jgi:hypothetical protein
MHHALLQARGRWSEENAIKNADNVPHCSLRKRPFF